VARGLRNDEPWQNVERAMRRLEERLAAGEWQPYDEDDPVVASWHEAYRRFGTNPRRSRPTLDALSRRLRKNGHLPRINSAVDAYNVICVTYGTPAGAFDLDALGHGPVVIRFAAERDLFTPLGEPGKSESPTVGEVVYAQGSRVLTRHWNHRDADQTKVTQTSRNVVFILERISAAAVPDDHIAAAQTALTELVAEHADAVEPARLAGETRVASWPDSVAR
jgi:DNA/RNA-binding domain of Phe-tRNA-synthetase-like protein